MTAGSPSRRTGGASGRGRLRQAALFAVAIASVAWLAVACSAGDASTPPSAAVAPASPSAAGPKPTNWPTLTVEATIALGAAHGEFTKMTDDVAAAIDSEDPARIMAVMNDTIEFLTANERNIPRLQAYDATKSVGDRLAVVYAKMIGGATTVRDGLTSGNGDAVEQGFQAFFEGTTDYVGIAPDLTPLAERALFMKRQLLR